MQEEEKKEPETLEKDPGGQPTKFKQEFVEQGQHLARLGFTSQQLADFFKVHIDTLYEWFKVYPGFSETIKSAKDDHDSDLVETSLLKRARGFKRIVQRLSKDGDIIDTEEEVPPDATSMIFWLKNRQQKRWRDKQELEHSGAVNLTAVIKDKDG